MFKYLKYLLSFLQILAFVLLISCESTKESEITVEGYLIELDTLINKDKKFDSIIGIYRHDLERELNEVIAYSEHVMERGTPEGLLNNFVADLVYNIGKELYDPDDENQINFCLLNYGGLRTSLPAGPITKANVFELLPFENELIVITLSGEKTWELFKYLAESEYGMPISGAKLGIANNKPKEVLINDEVFDRTKEYKVLTSDYLAEGGDNMDFFIQPLDSELIGMRVRDAIILHMKRINEQGKKISSRLDSRIYYID